MEQEPQWRGQKDCLHLFFPAEWLNENPNYLKDLPKTTETIPNKTLDQQIEAIFNWTGVCTKLKNITQPTLVIVGTDDVLTPPANSLLITERIPGAWLVQMKGGGHGLMYQYPEKFSSILLTFLSTTQFIIIIIQIKVNQIVFR